MTNLVVCDLDGTLLRPDATLSPYARDGLNTLLASGVALTIASARSLPAIKALLAGVSLKLPVIELNGAYLSDPTSGTHLISNTITTTTAVELLLPHSPILTTHDGTRDNVWFRDPDTWFIQEKQSYNDPRLRQTTDLLAIAKSEQLAAITVLVPHADAPPLLTALASVTDAKISAAPHEYSPGQTEINIHSPSATKGQAIQALRTRLALTGTITACGDHLNDLPMFAVATHKVAPANAHPAVLAQATTITPPNTEDGVIHYLLANHL